jgi:AcrR family transcriptional regulator
MSMSENEAERATPDAGSRRRVTRSAGRKGGGKLSPDQVLQVAIRIGDKESLDVLTMRRLAAELGVGTMTLYSYFRNKNELLDGVADHILGVLRLPSMSGVEVEDGLRLICHGLRAMMREHPSVVRIFISRTTRSERAMRGSYEQVLAALIELGLDPVLAAHAYGTLLVYSLGFSAYEIPRAWGRPSQDGDSEVEELRRQRRDFYLALPPQEFPSMVALADVLTTLPSEAQFDWGLNILIAGIMAAHQTS